MYLRDVWAEIRELPVPQRAAVLLNLRDVQALPLVGVATLREVAATLGMPAPALAAIWNRLPLEDAEIAALLHVRRQQVINYRKAARERLARRMARQRSHHGV
jgi:hypothetical protein